MTMDKKRVVAAVISSVQAYLLMDSDNDNVLTGALEVLNDQNVSTCITAKMACEKHPRPHSATVEGFVDVTVPNYSLDDFKSHFRMSRSTFQVCNCVVGVAHKCIDAQLSVVIVDYNYNLAYFFII